MKLKDILLINPRRGYISSEYGLGYQLPLGLIQIGGPLIDAGFKVKLIDADAEHLSFDELSKQALSFNPDIIGISHTGSTAAHLEAVKTIKMMRQHFPDAKIVYGGVYPTFAFRWIMNDVQEIDFIVRGEGEATALELMTALRDGQPLSTVKGIIWRRGQEIIVNTTRPVIKNLDVFRPGWELADWNNYNLLGERSSGIQFARGCPNACGFCGQWMFWRRFRHRSPQNIVDQIELLMNKYKVKHIWPADEHFTADRQALEEVLNELIKRGLRPSMSINATVDSIVRDADILHLYKKAGIDFIAMGVESDNDEVVARFGKSSYEMACDAVKLLHKEKVLSCVNVIYGLENESWKTLWRRFNRLRHMDPDFVNATYLTPHFWTPVGSKIPLDRLIQPDPAKWGYRNQVVATSKMSPAALFLGVKASEFFLHGRPKRVWRSLVNSDRDIRILGRRALTRALLVWMVEVFKDFPSSSFVKKGSFQNYPQSIRVLMPRRSAPLSSNRTNKRKTEINV